MATKKTSKSKKPSAGIMQGITNLGSELLGDVGKLVNPTYNVDSSGGKNESNGFVQAPERPADQTRRGVEGVKSRPTTYSQFTSRGNPIHTGDPFHADYDKGYEARYAIAANYKALDGRHNALLSFDGSDYGIPLFVQNLSIDFNTSGDVHQSQKGAIYYPKNFQQTALTLSCQAPNPFYYGKVLEAVRDSQMPFARVSRLEVWQPHDRDASIHGKWERIDCDGYVTLATRRHERHIFSPDFEIDFTVVVFRTPKAWADNIDSYTMQSDWHLMITPDPKTGKSFIFEEAPEVYKTAEEQRQAANRAMNTDTKEDQAASAADAKRAALEEQRKKSR